MSKWEGFIIFLFTLSLASIAIGSFMNNLFIVIPSAILYYVMLIYIFFVCLRKKP